MRKIEPSSSLLLRGCFSLSLACLSACLFGEVEGIPCETDDECPSSYFCDIPSRECRANTDQSSAPDLVIQKVRDPSGRDVRSPFIPVATASRLGFWVENRGLAPAENVVLTFAPLACFRILVDEATVPASLEGAASKAVSVEMLPAVGCEGLHILDWFLTWSGRETRGTIDVNVTGG